MADVIRLNVGGERYTTTLGTLTKFPNSMLGAMFNGKHNAVKDENGEYFIDRDGQLFRFVLNFLRSSMLALPAGFTQLDQLHLEADFFQIEPLVQEIASLQLKSNESTTDDISVLEITEVRTGITATMPTNNSRVKTVISGRSDIINRLPFVNAHEKLSYMNGSDFVELSCAVLNVRSKLSEWLLQRKWKLISSDFSSSSTFNSIQVQINLEHTFRDRWMCSYDFVSKNPVNCTNNSDVLNVSPE